MAGFFLRNIASSATVTTDSLQSYSQRAIAPRSHHRVNLNQLDVKSEDPLISATTSRTSSNGGYSGPITEAQAASTSLRTWTSTRFVSIGVRPAASGGSPLD